MWSLENSSVGRLCIAGAKVVKTLRTEEA